MAGSKDVCFTLYLANDAVRTPVLLEAIMAVSNAHVELVKDLPQIAEPTQKAE